MGLIFGNDESFVQGVISSVTPCTLKRITGQICVQGVRVKITPCTVWTSGAVHPTHPQSHGVPESPRPLPFLFHRHLHHHLLHRGAEAAGGEAGLVGIVREDQEEVAVATDFFRRFAEGFRRAAPSDFPWWGGLNRYGITGLRPAVLFRWTDLMKASFQRPVHQKSTAAYAAMPFLFAEAEGFEPPGRCRPTVFKTAAIDHSATPPVTGANLVSFAQCPKLFFRKELPLEEDQV